MTTVLFSLVFVLSAYTGHTGLEPVEATATQDSSSSEFQPPNEAEVDSAEDVPYGPEKPIFQSKLLGAVEVAATIVVPNEELSIEEGRSGGVEFEELMAQVEASGGVFDDIYVDDFFGKLAERNVIDPDANLVFTADIASIKSAFSMIRKLGAKEVGFKVELGARGSYNNEPRYQVLSITPVFPKK